MVCKDQTQYELWRYIVGHQCEDSKQELKQITKCSQGLTFLSNFSEWFLSGVCHKIEYYAIQTLWNVHILCDVVRKELNQQL